MKTEEIKADKVRLKREIEKLINAFTEKNGICEVKISSESYRINIGMDREVIAGCTVNVEIVI